LRVDFSIRSWAAWAPGLATAEAWRAWAAGPALPPLGEEAPALTEVPPLARRRVERSGRAAFQAAAWCQGEAAGLPLVFASRHGAVCRSVELLTELARGEPLSPAGFALSVHNAVCAQYSIVRGERGNVSAVANGRFTVEAAVVEAVAQLLEAPRVLLVAYDGAGPPLYARFRDEPDADFAFAWLLEAGGEYALESCEVAPSPSDALPHALEVLRFALGAEASLTRADELAGWRWSRGG
jgi:hypothetical protein